MKAYEAGNPAYFATPPVNLIYAYRASLELITARRSPSAADLPSEVVVSLEQRFELHKLASAKVRAAAAELGIKAVPLDATEAANGMTAVSLFFQNEVGRVLGFLYAFRTALLPRRPRCFRYSPSSRPARDRRCWRSSC